jgi:hypothetical protein
MMGAGYSMGASIAQHEAAKVLWRHLLAPPALCERRHRGLARRLVTHRAGYTFFTRITSCSGTAGAYASTEELIVHQPLSTKKRGEHIEKALLAKRAAAQTRCRD